MTSFEAGASLEHYVRFQVAYFSTKYKLIKPIVNVHLSPPSENKSPFVPSIFAVCSHMSLWHLLLKGTLFK